MRKIWIKSRRRYRADGDGYTLVWVWRCGNPGGCGAEGSELETKSDAQLDSDRHVCKES